MRLFTRKAAQTPVSDGAGTVVLPGDPPVEIAVRRSARARRFSLRVSGADGQVTLSLPARARLAEALDFTRSQEDWIRAALARRPQGMQAVPGAVVLFEGRALTIAESPVRAPRVEGELLLVPPGQTGARVAAFLKLAARQRLQAACERHAAALGLPFAGITLRDTRSRWGSCTVDGRLMFSWRLIMAPPEVLDYVAAHEVAHLAEMNHSPAFWAVVRGLVPDYEAPRDWLRRNGASLHRYRFGA
jgi:predicted metal-dependent hydrolase